MHNYRQIALVVRHVEATRNMWWELLGIGPWDVRRYPETEVAA
jgi:hypothetical protein